MPQDHVGGDYTPVEWRDIASSACFDDVPWHQVMLLHRHWIWANHARRCFEDALQNEDWNDKESFTARTPWAMYIWYGLLCALIEGVAKRKVKYGGRLARDIREIREPLREARNATFHVGGADAYWDVRLFEIATNPGSAHQIRRVHSALGQLLLNELRRRRSENA